MFAEPLRYRKQTAIRIKDHTIHIMLGKTRKHFLHPRFIERRMFQQKREVAFLRNFFNTGDDVTEKAVLQERQEHSDK